MPFCVWLKGISTVRKGQSQATPRFVANPLFLPILLRYAYLPPSSQHSIPSPALTPLVDHHFNGHQTRLPFAGAFPITFRVPLSPLSYRQHKLPPLVPEPLMMLMVHYWLSITSLASQHPKNHSFSLPPGHFPTRLWGVRPPFVGLTQLQPSLPAGFRDISTKSQKPLLIRLRKKAAHVLHHASAKHSSGVAGAAVGRRRRGTAQGTACCGQRRQSVTTSPTRKPGTVDGANASDGSCTTVVLALATCYMWPSRVELISKTWRKIYDCHDLRKSI